MKTVRRMLLAAGLALLLAGVLDRAGQARAPLTLVTCLWPPGEAQGEALGPPALPECADLATGSGRVDRPWIAAC